MKIWMRYLAMGTVLVAWSGLATAAEGEKKVAPKATKMECEIVSVNTDAKSIEVKSGDKTETLSLSPKAKVIVNGEEKSLSDLKAGDKCKCTVYDKKEGKSVSRIVVGEDTPKKKKKAE